MIRVTKVFRRTSIDTPWYRTPKVFAEYIKTEFVETGKRVGRVEIKSEDNLTVTIVTDWVNQDAYNAYIDMPIHDQLTLDRNRYNKAASITCESTDVSEVASGTPVPGYTVPASE
jgi:hypothetical protein